MTLPVPKNLHAAEVTQNSILWAWEEEEEIVNKVICIVDTDETQNPDYTSLKDAIEGEAGESPKCVTSSDLVANDEQLIIICKSSDGSADSSLPVEITGFTTGPDNYIEIRPHKDQEHEGEWDDSIYRLSFSPGSTPFYINQSYVCLIKMQLRINMSWDGDRSLLLKGVGAKGIHIDSCIFHYNDTTEEGMDSLNPPCLLWYGTHDRNQADEESYVINNIFIGNEKNSCIGIHSDRGSGVVFANNTIHGLRIGIKQDFAHSYPYFINNICVDNETDYDFGTPSWIKYSISSDTSAAGTGSLTEISSEDLFVNVSERDFRLKETAPAIDAGDDLSAFFDHDIMGTSRPQGEGFDIGAYEYGEKEGYEIEYGPLGGSYETSITSDSSFLQEDLDPDTDYEARVRAVDGEKFSDWTEWVQVTTEALPLYPPENIQAAGISTSEIEVSWDAVSNATGYKIRYRKRSI